MRHKIMANPQFWQHWLLRLLAEIALAMLGFGGCIGAFELLPVPATAMLGIFCSIVPVKIGGILAGRGAKPGMRRGAVALLLPLVVLAVCLPLTAAWHFIAILLITALAEMLLIATDDCVDCALIDMTDAVHRVRTARIYVIGVVAPALAALLISRTTYGVLVRLSVVLFVLGTLFSAAMFPCESTEDRRRRSGRNPAPGDVCAAAFIANFCIAMSHGALLIPMMLTRTSVGTLAAAVACLFVGMALGSLLDPLRDFYSTQHKGFCKNCTILLLALVMLFGMARTGWQWNLLALAGGVLIASAWGNIHAMGLQENAGLQRINGAAHTLGAVAGLVLGGNVELLSRNSSQISGFFARLVGQGEGSGYAVAFVIIGCVGALLLDAVARKLRQKDE